MTSNESDGEITLNAGTTTELHVSGIVEDLDGQDDITSIDLAFYSDGAESDQCSEHPTNCYKVSGCSKRNATNPNQKEFDCMKMIQYWANGTVLGGYENGNNWNAKIVVTDAQSDTGNKTDTIDIGTTLALTFPEGVAWGTLEMGASTTALESQLMTVYQGGNAQSDVEASGTNMTCSGIGEIPVANIEWDVLNDDGYGGAGANSLSATPANIDLSIGYKTVTEVDPSGEIHWDLLMPSIDVSGTCSGTITLNAVSDS